MKTIIATLLTMLAIHGLQLNAQESPSDVQASAYRNSLAQEDVRKQSQKILEALLLLIQDLNQNGGQIKGNEEARKLAQQLATLNKDQIGPIVEQLRKVGNEGASAAQLLSEASKSQKQVQVNLKKYENDLAVRINIRAVELRLRQIALRQVSNLRQSREIVSMKEGGKLNRSQAQVFAICQSEQAGLKEEIGLVLQALAKMVADVPESDRPGFAEALAESKRLNVTGLAETATEQTALATFPDCLNAQAAFLDGLQAMMIKAGEKQGVEDRVRALQEQFQQLARAQFRAAENTKVAGEKEGRDVLEDQNRVTDQLVLVGKEVSVVDAGAARFAQDAGQSIDKVSLALKGNPALRNELRQSVTENQLTAAQRLQDASDALKKFLEKLAQGAGDAPKSVEAALNALAELDKKVHQAMARQQLLDKKPAVADQTKLADETIGLQQEALPLVPAAAPFLGQAAGHMRQDKTKAYPALVLASEEIAKQMKTLAQAQAEIDKLQAAANKIAEAQALAQNAAQNLQQAKPDMAGSVQQMQQAEQALDQAQAPAAAEEALQKAEDNLQAAVMSAAQAQQQKAAAANAQAQQAMQQAQQSLQQAMGQATAAALGQGKPQPAMAAGFELSMDGDVTDFMASSALPELKGKVLGSLGTKDRDSIAMLEKEKTPGEYQGMVQQYLKNLAEGLLPASKP